MISHSELTVSGTSCQQVVAHSGETHRPLGRFEGSSPLPQFAQLSLTLTCDRLFGWLQMTPPNR
ncbi:hypothetical protein E1H12_00095 [Geitlerinema sp. P-1104]|nr:hypothetical protein [Geitlerinema sp. P-1104]